MSEFKTNPIVQSCAAQEFSVGWLVEIKEEQILVTSDVFGEDECAAV